MRQVIRYLLVISLCTAPLLAANRAATPLPRVVARVALSNQTAAIPPTALFTAPKDGLYRITAYIAETVPGGSGGSWSVGLQYNDLAGGENFGESIGCIQVNEALREGPVRLLAGQPLTYEVDDSNASGTYEVVITVERLF